LRFVAFLLLLLILLPKQAYAASPRSAYYDFGPYYYNSQQQVLGVTLSSLEQLPVPQIPQQAEIPQATGVLPGNFLHPFETFVENVQLTFTTDPIKREELRLGIAAERLSEAKTLIDQGKGDLAADAITSYKNTITTVSKNMEDLAQKNVAGIDSLITKVETAAATQSIAAQALALSSSPVVAQTWSQAVDASKQSMDKAADAAHKPPIPDDLSTSLQDLKERGLITPEESNKLYSLDSRAKVREELDKLSVSGQFPTAEVAKLDEAVFTRFPDTYKQTVNVLQFAELRAYQTQSPPTDEILTAIEKWQEQSANVPPPQEIRPYLYYSRAQQLAKEIDFTGFADSQRAEIVKFYSQEVTQNPTFVPPSVAPAVETVTPPVTGATTATESADSSSPSAAPSESSPAGQPTASTPAIEPYLTAYQGPLPGEGGYFFKQLGEGFSLTTTFDPARRIELSLRYAQERLREASALSGDPQKEAVYAENLKKYKDSIKKISDQVENFRGPAEAQKTLARNLETQAGRHAIIFEKGLLPATADLKAYQEVIEAAENAMDKSADILDKPALPVALSNRLQDLKAQGLILPEEVDKLTQADSREEVRALIRDFSKEGIFPPADAKKLDEAQALVSPSDFNQLVEVRKVEELQNLRSVQTDLAQTPTLKNNANVLSQREKSLTESIDISLIKPEDLTGREGLKAVYDKLAATSSARPINRGQFGNQPPPPTDAVLTACPQGAIFKQFEGCVWADSGKKINDYNQYKCFGAGQYYSFAAQKCVPYEKGRGFGDDASPICPAGYSWAWQSQSCETSAGGVTPLPIPSPGPGDSDSCPQESSYQAPNGCVWDNNGKKVADSTDYKCENNQYYSFSQFKCVLYPTLGFVSPNDFVPSCKDPNTYWSWSDGKCTMPRPIEGGTGIKEINIPQPTFVPPGNPFYFAKQLGEGLQKTFAFTPQAREQVSLSQAKERLAEAAYALKKDDKAGVKAAITSYISAMQNLVADIPREGLSEGAKQEIAKRLSDGSVEQNLMLQKLSAWAKEEEDDLIQAATSMPILGVDRAVDVLGEPPIPDDIRTKIEALPAEMISEENKKKLLDADSRVAVRAELINLSNVGGLGKDDVVFLNDDFNNVDIGAQVELEELSKLADIADITDQKDQIAEKVEKNEDIVKKLDEFQKNFEPGQEIPAEIRPYVRLTRIDEITQTIRPDVVRLEDFQNRKDVQLAVATLQEEFRPTSQSIQQVRDFRRRNPGAFLPPDLARIEALSYNLGVRNQAGPCYLPTPPFPANTPCPAPGASIPIASYGNSYWAVDPFLPDSDFPVFWPGRPSGNPSVDKDGKPLVYGQGPKPESAGVCQDGYHWMYDSGGWCMSNDGSYSSSYNYTPTGTGPGYTPYSPYYTAPGAPPATYGYPTGGNYYTPPYSYGAPSYYGPAPTNYTTNPPSGTVPGSGPAPTAPGQCPSGFHWMSDSGGWCMSNGNTYVPSGTPGGYPYSPNVNQSSCGPGYYWNGNGCVPTSSTDTPYYGGGGGPITCSPPYGGCGSGWWDNGSCSCKQASSQGCYNVSASSCGSGFYWDSGACTCRSNTTSSGGGTTTSSSGSCPSGYHWMGDNGGWCMSDAGGGTTSTSTNTSTSTSTSSGSCPSGSHWMSDNGGYCMSDGGGTTSTSTSPAPTSSPTSSPEPAPTSAPTTPVPTP